MFRNHQASGQSTSTIRRRLSVERLEDRRLCAGVWCNPNNALDVDQSGLVVPLDALLVINDLNSNGVRRLNDRPSNAGVPLIDVNDDGAASAIDVLLIINALNQYNRPLTISIEPNPYLERVLEASGSVHTFVSFDGKTLGGVQVTLESIGTAAPSLPITTTSSAEGNFHCDFIESGSALRLRFTAVDPLGRRLTRDVDLPATDSPTSQLTARIAGQHLPQVGSQAPMFTAADENFLLFNSADYRNKNRLVVVFYPVDEESDTVTELNGFQQQLEMIRGLGAEVVAVSFNSVESHRAFATAHGYGFPLLSDGELTVAEQFGVLAERLGAPYSLRATFIIGSDGSLQKVYTDIDVNHHAEEVARYLDRMIPV